jgi:exonuclease III
VQRGSDVVCLQETHVGFFDQGRYTTLINTACRQMDPQHPGFSIHWGFNTSPNANRSAGVAILIKRSLIASGELVLHEDGKVGDQGSGRFLKLPVTWVGQRMNVVCVHLPNEQHRQVQFIRAHLAGIASEPGFWGGDFNFVLDTPLDRLSVHMPGAPLLAMAPEGEPAAAPGFSDSEDEGGENEQGQVPAVGRQAPRPARVFAQVAPGMHDCFRLLHPRQRSFTWHGVGGRKGYASRIDRWHCSSQFSAYVVRCGTKSPSPSDHRPLVVEVLSRRPASQGRGYRRARPQNFWDDEQARGDFTSSMQVLDQGRPKPSNMQQALALLQWWPRAKLRMLNKCTELNLRVRAAHQAQAAAEGAAPAAELEAAYTAVEIFTTPDRIAASIQRVLTARQAWREAANKANARAEWQARREWVHSKEQPSKGLTAVLQSQLPAESRLLSGLVSPATGRLVTEGRPMAQLMATYQANISQASPRDPAALQEVLDALTHHGITLSAAEAAELGSLEITPEEVKVALKHSEPGKAPGLDGLPVELYRRCGDVCIPLLADLYTAMGMTGMIPKGLLDGVITSIFKKGQRADPANYRPITVLNSDYRVLAKVLANRLKRCIGKLIHPMQSGFVPGRLIGENILLNQMLPTAVGPNSMAAAVYCDFRKAYDTVDRNFLYAVMEALGVGDGFLRWVKLLLTSTSACAQINGHLSRTVPFTAGVRQGCPLAPYLYLFVTEALYCLLKDRDFGVQVEGKKLVACMYADDNQSYLTDMFTELRLFKQALQTFHQASGEAVNFSKSHVVPIGRGARNRLWVEHYVGQLQRQHPHLEQAQVEGQAAQLARTQLIGDKASIPPGLQMEGFKVVDEVVSLGITFRADGTVFRGLGRTALQGQKGVYATQQATAVYLW